MKHLALYLRVSTSEQTVETQRRKLVEYAVNMGYTYDIFEEVESTRKTRPIKQKLMSKLRNHEYFAVAVYKLDRWGRSSRELLLDIQELVDKKIGFISLTDSLDFTTASGKLHFAILSAFSEFERELIRERTVASLQRKRAEGYIFTGRPKGAKDRKKRKTTGYYEREARKREMSQSKQVLSPNN